MTIQELKGCYSELEMRGRKILFVGTSGAGIIDVNAGRAAPISWLAGLFRASELSFLTLTAKEISFWPDSCMDEVFSQFGNQITRFRNVVMFGFSMRGWGILYHAERFRAAQVLALSPRTPETSQLYDIRRFGPIIPRSWPDATKVLAMSDFADSTDRRDMEILNPIGSMTWLDVHGAGHDTLALFRPDRMGKMLLRRWRKGLLDQAWLNGFLARHRIHNTRWRALWLGESKRLGGLRADIVLGR